MRKVIIPIVCFCVMLSGCKDNNQLLQEKHVSIIKDELINLLFLGINTDQLQKCPAYLAAPSQSPNLKNECQPWVAKTYAFLMDKGELPATTTLKEFSDPKLWKLLNPVRISYAD